MILEIELLSLPPRTKQFRIIFIQCNSLVLGKLLYLENYEQINIRLTLGPIHSNNNLILVLASILGHSQPKSMHSTVVR